MKNALERGQPLQQVKQSFLNAGYKAPEVEAAARYLSQTGQIQMQKLPQQSEIKKVAPSPKTLPAMKAPMQDQQNLPPTPPIQTQAIAQPQIGYGAQINGSKLPRWLIISLIVSGALIIILAGTLGLMWEKLF
jgi:hypothetical protein